MGIQSIKMPDVGEGVAEAEITEISIPVGGVVQEDEIFATVMTDKATFEVPSSFTGRITWYAGEVGDLIAVGAPLVKIDVDDMDDEPEDKSDKSNDNVKDDDKKDKKKSAKADNKKQSKPEPKAASAKTGTKPSPAKPKAADAPNIAMRKEGEKPLASPAVRNRAREAGIDLRMVMGSGPAGRITHSDLDTFLENGGSMQIVSGGKARNNNIEEIKIVGMRRKIAERMQDAKRNIPHITIVEEVDVTALEELRAKLNNENQSNDKKPKLTQLPFLMGSIVKAIEEQPTLNAHYDDENDLLSVIGAAHIGIATQTEAGLMVPVVRHCESLSIWQMASEIKRLSDAARDGTAAREELSGSTITITSLGKLGAIAATPIINRPEVAIVGVNKIATRPVWNDNEFVPRQIMNISCSFDHRIVDGWDAAVFVQKLKTLLETPAMIFIEG